MKRRFGPADIDLRQALDQYHITKTDDRLTMPLHLLVLDLLRREPPGLVGRVFPWRGEGGPLEPLPGPAIALPVLWDSLHPAHGKALLRHLARG